MGYDDEASRRNKEVSTDESLLISMSKRPHEITEVVQKVQQVLTEGFEENRITASYRQGVESTITDLVERISRARKA